MICSFKTEDLSCKFKRFDWLKSTIDPNKNTTRKKKIT